MIYGGLLLVVAALLYLTKRSIALTLVVMLASALLADLVTADLASMIIGVMPSWPKTAVTASVRLIILLLPALVVLTRAPKISRDLLFKIIDSGLLTALIIALAGSTLAGLVKLDLWSLQIHDFILNNSKWLMIGAGAYGFYGLLKKPDEG